MSITFEKVSHIYGENTPFSFLALKEVTTEIKKGSMTAIIGHTGSGKSTLVQHLNGLLLPSSGTVTIDEYSISPDKKPEVLKPLRKKTGLVFQFPEYQLFEETIEKDIIFGPINFGIEESIAKENAKKALKAVGLDESYLERSPFDLSGGQKRRVAIAGILVMEPEVLVLDEPTAGLDPQGAKEMMTLFKNLNQQGTTILLVTHDMNQVLQYCDQAIVMSKGEVVKSGFVQDIFSQPEYLNDLSIELPMLTQIIYDLNANGFNLDSSIADIETLAKAIGGELK